MSEANLHVELREKTGHHAPKALRREGRIPAIFYAHGEEAVPLHVDAKLFNRLSHQEVNIFNVIFPDGKERKSIVREIQRNPVNDAIIHIDILGIKLDEKIRLSVPVILVGSPVGVKEGGILEHLLREVEVEGLPLELPEHVEVDVSGLAIGDVVTLEDIPVDKFKFVTEIHHAVANVIQPKVVLEPEPVEVEELEGEAIEGEEAGEEAEASQEDESKSE